MYTLIINKLIDGQPAETSLYTKTLEETISKIPSRDSYISVSIYEINSDTCSSRFVFKIDGEQSTHNKIKNNRVRIDNINLQSIINHPCKYKRYYGVEIGKYKDFLIGNGYDTNKFLLPNICHLTNGNGHHHIIKHCNSLGEVLTELVIVNNYTTYYFEDFYSLAKWLAQ